MLHKLRCCLYVNIIGLWEGSQGREAHHTAPGHTMMIFKIDDDRTIRFAQTVVKFHLQALGIPRYSFRHSLQTQTLAVHMRPGAAALVWASSDRSSAHQQRKNESPNPAERSPLLRPGRRHDIHSNYFQTEVNWKSAGGEVDVVEVRIPKKVKRGRSTVW